jgi:hypothetical protein
MTNLTRTGGWNPFQLYVNGTKYDVKNIQFYENGKVCASVGRGWFGNNNMIREPLPIPDVKLRRKPVFDGETFIIGKAGECVLYIPVGFFEFEITTYSEDKGYYSNLYDVYTSKRNPLVSFMDYGSRKEVVNQAKKEWAESLLVFINGVKAALAPMEEELEKLDRNGRLAKEREENGYHMTDTQITKMINEQLYALKYEVVIRKK